MERHRERTMQEELLAGIVASTIANYSFAPPKKALSPADCMPSQWQKREQEKRIPARPANRKQVAQNVRCFLAGRMQSQQEVS